MSGLFTYEFDRKPGGHVYAAGYYDDDGTLLAQGEEITWHPLKDFSTKFKPNAAGRNLGL